MKRLFLTLITAIIFLASSMPSSFAADTSAPQLVDWALTVYEADISKTDAIVTARFILSDDSDIAPPNLLLKSLSTTQVTSFATVKELSRSGKLVSYEASATIKFGQSPRAWEWVLYPLRDSLGNASTSFGPGNNWASQISIIDGTFTRDISQCEGQVKGWNRSVEYFQDLEKKYVGAQELAVVRLKFEIPIEILGIEGCMSDAFRLKYAKLINIRQTLAVILAEVLPGVNVRVEQENKAKQTAAEKIAADELARQKVEADKAAAKKKSTITCIKGKLTKKVTAVNPKCPSGYKVKK